MGAPPKNQFWKLRSKHGRDKLFKTPDILWDACCEYFEMMDKRRWVEKDWVGKDAVEVERETQPPYTLTGLYVFLDIDRMTWSRYKTEESCKDFSAVITRVEEIIYTQKFEGASVGAYNANIIARDLGLADKKDLSHTLDTERNRITELFKPADDASGEPASGVPG